jgi:signal transduction histidine kinase
MKLGGAKFSESFAHAVLCVLRELVINAVRHGKAANVVVTGWRDGDGFAFSVSDDGRGFDVASAKGVEEGHYGLQGVRERIRQFGGELRVESAPGKGTTARFSVSEDV